jgi:O-antigen chain-terminating methyltransferase
MTTNIKKDDKFLKFFKDREIVLDLGCGDGRFLSLLNRKGILGYGVDSDKEAAKAARARVNPPYFIYHGEILKFLGRTGEKFDGVFCSNVIEHLSPQELRTLFSLIAENMPPGGKLALTTANPQCLGILADSFWRDITHIRLYPTSLLVELLQTAGFKILKAGPDEDTRSQAPWRRALRAFRTLLIGNYFGTPEIYIMAVKL